MFPYLEYLSSNKLIKFPFSELAVLPDQIPNDLIVDLLIVTETPDIVYYLNRLEYTPTQIKLQINGNEIVIDRTSTTMYGYFDGSIKIKILLGRLSLDLAYGAWDYTESQTKFESCCVVPYSRIVHTLNNLNNDVLLAEGYNTSLIPSGNQVQIAFTSGAGLGTTPCEPYEYEFISKINNEEVENNLLVKGLDCISIIHYPETNMIVINDRCKPCCQDCADKLTEITTNTSAVQDAIDALIVRIEALGG